MKLLKMSLASVAGATFALLSASSSADLGHSTPGGVSPHNHLHLFGDMVISPSWLVGIGIIVAIVAAMVMQRIRARATKG